ncbi:DEAD/DEAH box helicase [Nocardioides sp. WS12]|uniref:DEAD/DEAH box helicase n=1 Tax=Nocardioides sp. WS12 TaxID=2486272 RepID=UPI0015FA457C|nr:DEAD/DEAH box helicase [Nocardioides sp. WS12]
MRGEELANEEFVDILRFAVLFLRSSDDVVSRLGYRIVLQYGETTGDYEPLHAVATTRELMPVVAATERIDPDLAETESLAAVLFNAHSTNFVTVEPSGQQRLRTRGQMDLRAFNTNYREAVIVAPTSYGKSEMLVDKVAQALDQATCVLVPTRALISQTQRLLIEDPRVRRARIRVLTHPDAYNDEDRFIAVMTQERFHRLLNENPELRVDQLLVDEAHGLLSSDQRAVELSQVVLTARHRNPTLGVTYYTPFMSEPTNLRHVNGADQRTQARSVNEHVKAEKFIVDRPGESSYLYDQFLDERIALEERVPTDELEALEWRAGHRTLVYVNRPKDAQDLVARLSSRLSPADLSAEARRAIRAIGDLIDPSYSLIGGIEKGVLFHHGQVPDLLRQYIERLFSTDPAISKRILVTTSTLLEGVNTPADCLILLTPSRGRRHLSRSGFRNLIGRVARFGEVFDPDRRDLDLLQPRIHLIPGSYAPTNWNVDSFLTSRANLARAAEDEVRNPLLEGSADNVGRQAALEYLENIEPGTSQLSGLRTASTEVGRLCFLNGVYDFDIFESEQAIQDQIDALREREQLLETPEDVLDALAKIFLEHVDLDDDNELARIRDYPEARTFYAMFIEWRMNGEPFKQLISRFVRYWTQLRDQMVYVGPRWGEEVYGEYGWRKMYIRMASKTRAGMINLAVVKIKEEQDFVDFRLSKYFEILHSLGFLEPRLYNQLKYGTDDPFIICLLRNGFSRDLARLVADQYQSLVSVNLPESTVTVPAELPLAMAAQDENDILVYEAETLVNLLDD